MDYEIGQKVVWVNNTEFIKKYDTLTIIDNGNFGFYLLKIDNIKEDKYFWYRTHEQDGTINFSHIAELRQYKINKIKERICLKKVI